MTDSFKQRPLSSINDSLMKVEKALSQIKSEEKHCLEAVVNCRPLVHWLKETLGGKKYIVLLYAL